MNFKDSELFLDISDRTSPHTLVLPLISKSSTILDVGCNVGYFGEYFINYKNCICDGVDINESFLKKAKKKGYREVYKIDLYYDTFKVPGKYDCILFIDILEHLPNPYRILQKIVDENLKDSGQVVVCVPNIARFEYRCSHLLGKFDYEQSRILSKDHLRFFTKRSAEEMITSSGLKILKEIPTGLAQKLRIIPTLTAFQFIFLCKKKNF